jgi:glucan 1,3-beta-glucosidase
VPTDDFYSARFFKAAGDGSTDDTLALNALFNFTASLGKVAYLDAGIYMVTDTIFIPPNAKIVGEAQASIIMATGSKFQDTRNPWPVVRVGNSGEIGSIEWSDTIVSTQGPCAGAVLIEYNLYAAGLPSGM